MNPSPDTEHTLRGEATHWIGEQALSHPDMPVFSFSSDPNGTHIDAEMIEAARVYVADIEATFYEQAHGEGLHLEHRVSIPRIHAECFGTPDAFWFDALARVLYIWDFKFGYGIVEAPDNWQAICYAAGIIDYLGLDDQTVTVCVRIVQPRAFHPGGPVREWRVPATDLRGPINQLESAANEIMRTDRKQKLCTGVHCRYCESKHQCPALRGAAYYACDVVDFIRVPEVMSSAEAGLELRLLEAASKRLEYRIEGLRADLEYRIKSGDAHTGHEMRGGTGAPEWLVPADEVFALGDLCGIDLRKKPAPITVTQAKKKGIDELVINDYSTRKKSALKLVPIDANEAARVFGAK
jgi:hypothetical protein